MKSLLTTSVLTLALCAGGTASAQLAASSRAPVDVAGDHSEFVNSECLSTWSGNVEALQDNARLRTDLLKLYLEKNAKGGGGANSSSCGNLSRMEAQGSIYYVTPQQRVHGDNAVYEAANDTLTLTGDVVAVQGQNVIRGQKMVINTKTGEGHMVGAASGRNQPNRVRGVFYPNQSSQPAKPATPAKPAQPR
jgi:lipopolysaccharide export system protein LptA